MARRSLARRFTVKERECRHTRLMELFDRACELPPDERTRFAEEETDDPHLRAELLAMLAEDARSRVFFDLTAGAADLLARDALLRAVNRGEVPAPDPDAPLPEHIGGYRILRRIGAGGMGTVYEAEQEEPQRRVALKTLHPWWLSPSAMDRFRFEAQALAKLRHPGIPPIYAVGEDQGRLYFVMELVEGATLLRWAEDHRPSDRARVALLARICDAVHHAHLRGVIHRDIKPDNIRVGLDGQPRVLDFGIALATETGVALDAQDVGGTLGYMSPEQLDPQRPVDVRADVYSLGVTGYELLSGARPLTLTGLPLERALEVVRTSKPRPLASHRPDLPQDLCSIFDKALAPDPEQRYGSAAELANDLRAWLRCLPVSAHDGGTLYVAGRFARRHRTVVALATAAVLATVGGGAASFWAYRRTERARSAERTQRLAAEHASSEAEEAANRAEATLRFLTSLLAEADPERTLGRQVTVEQAVDRAMTRLDEGALDQRPRVEAAVRVTAGEVYAALGAPRRAEDQFRRAATLYQERGIDPDSTYATALRMLATGDWEAGRYDRAIEGMERVVRLEQALSQGQPNPRLAEALHVYAMTLREAGRLPEAIEAFARSGEMNEALWLRGELDPDQLAAGHNQRAYALLLVGRMQEAERFYREALAIDMAQYGPEHPEVATDYHHIAFFEMTAGHCEETLRLLRAAYEIRARTLGPRHIRVGIQRGLRATCELRLGRIAQAEESIEEALQILGMTYGQEHPRYLRNLETRARILLARGRPAEARALASRIVTGLERAQGTDHWSTAMARALLGETLAALGHSEEARIQLRRSLEIIQRQLGPHNAQAQRIRERLDNLALPNVTPHE